MEPEIPPARLWKGARNWVKAVPAEPLPFTTFIGRGENVQWEVSLDEPLIAPLPRGAVVGALILSDNKGELRRIPLLTAEEAAPGNIFKRGWDTLGLFFKRAFAKKQT
ncbi:hypothetical protein FACS1894137_18230 [Spirochaetia bacterium]|nr:hypothetical protein FACS1894137_18230 [Spirochaetia bacterium]